MSASLICGCKPAADGSLWEREDVGSSPTTRTIFGGKEMTKEEMIKEREAHLSAASQPQTDEFPPYSEDEQRVADYLSRLTPEIGTGADPVGFLMASHAALVADGRRLRRVIYAAERYRAQEHLDTPRLFRGKKLHDLGVDLDKAIEDWAEGN